MLIFILHSSILSIPWNHPDTVTPPVGVRSIVINPSVCLSVCPLDRSSRNFVCSFPVVRSSSGGVASCIHYVLPVLWLTSRLVVMGRMARAALRYRDGIWCLWMPCFQCISNASMFSLFGHRSHVTQKIVYPTANFVALPKRIWFRKENMSVQPRS